MRLPTTTESSDTSRRIKLTGEIHDVNGSRIDLVITRS